MQWLSQFHHDIVGNVNQVGNRAHASALQTMFHPKWGTANLSTFNHRASKTMAKCRRIVGNVHLAIDLIAIFGGDFDWANRLFQQRPNFFGNVVHAQAVAAVWCQINIQYPVIQTEIFHDINAEWCIFWQYTNAIFVQWADEVFINADFLHGADHSVGFFTTQLRGLNNHISRKNSTNLSKHDLLSCSDIRRPADNFDHIFTIGGYCAHMQMVRIWMIFTSQHLCNNNTLDALICWFYAANFNTSAGDDLRQFVGGWFNINIFF